MLPPNAQRGRGLWGRSRVGLASRAGRSSFPGNNPGGAFGPAIRSVLARKHELAKCFFLRHSFSGAKVFSFAFAPFLSRWCLVPRPPEKTDPGARGAHRTAGPSRTIWRKATSNLVGGNFFRRGGSDGKLKSKLVLFFLFWSAFGRQATRCLADRGPIKRNFFAFPPDAGLVPRARKNRRRPYTPVNTGVFAPLFAKTESIH